MNNTNNEALPAVASLSDETGENVSEENTEEAAEQPETLNRESLLGQLRDMQASLRVSGNTQTADRLEDYVAEISMNAPHKEPESEEEVEEIEKREKYPEWGESLENKEAVFLKKGSEKIQAMWEPYEKLVVMEGKPMVSVGYQRLNNHLFPGRKKHEQGLDLKIIDNTFSVNEWRNLVEPILERYVQALQLRNLSKLPDNMRDDYQDEIRKTLSNVFKAGEIRREDITESISKDTMKKVNGMVNTINTDPEVLKSWIREMVGRAKPAPVAETRTLSEIIEKMKSREKSKKESGISVLEKEWGISQEENKDKFEEKVEEIAYKIEQVGQQLLTLNAKYSEGIRGSHEKMSDFEETPYMQYILGDLAKAAEHQLTKKRGVTNLIGDMGVGKNYVVEHFAASSNRPFFYFPCARGMEPEDLAYHFEFKGNETLIVPSALGRGLTTPNSVILIDEPNALPPHVISALHGVADHNRSFVYNGMEFKAADGVVIVFAMNPAGYEHVHDMPEALADRTMGLDIYMDYPPFTKLDEIALKQNLSDAEKQEKLQEDSSLDSIYVCDEALILRRRLPELAKYSNEEFKNLWDVALNSKHKEINAEMIGEAGEDVEKVKPVIADLLKIIKVLDVWRQAYKKGRMSRTISIRGALAVVDRYVETNDIKRAFTDILRRHQYKYGGGEFDYKNLEEMLVNDAAFIEQELTEFLGV
jgi:MoxR-like ATPase